VKRGKIKCGEKKQYIIIDDILIVIYSNILFDDVEVEILNVKFNTSKLNRKLK